MKLLLISLLLAGVAVVLPTKERAKRYAQEPQEPQLPNAPNLGTSSPIERLFNGISGRFGRIRDRLENLNSTGYLLRDRLSNIAQQRNGSLLLDGFLRRMNETWTRRFSGSNSAIPSRNIQLLRVLINLRNTSSADVRTRIDGLLRGFFSDLNQRLSTSNMTVPSRNLQELRELIRQRMQQDRNGTERLEILLNRIRSIMNERSSGPGRIPPRTTQTSGGGSVSSEHSGGDGSPTTSNQSGSGSGSGESGSSGSGESGNSS